MSNPRIFSYLFLAACGQVSMAAFAQDDLRVISGPQNQWLQHGQQKDVLYHHFTGEAYALLDERRDRVSRIATLPGWQSRQRDIRQTLLYIAGPFPAKTPLNSSVTRTVRKDFYRIEHIVFESQPGFFVTSSLYIPASLRKGRKAPAIIYCSGHTAEGYRSKVYQHVILNLVKKGFIVFAFDPVGQGERLEYYDDTQQKSIIGGPTAEHSYPGSQAFISGSSQARYMIWDGIRAIDYLLSRSEVDAARIGITGRSGGGTQSAYIAAFDDRILAAAPECYMTTLTRLLQSIGPQDAEQNFPGAILKGFDLPDLLAVRAPKPALMITTTRDIFSIQGARECAGEVERIYESYGKPAHFAMVEDDAGHASTKKNREAMYAFFQKHLGNPGIPADEELPLPWGDELRVTATGQVSTTMKRETVYSLNARETQKIISARPTAQGAAILAKAKQVSGYRDPSGAGRPVFAGRIQRDGYAIEKYFLQGEGNYVIPYLMMIPAQSSGKTVLYLHPDGKGAEAGPGGEIEFFVNKGFTVIAPDLPGIGELSDGAFKGDAFIGGVSHNVWYSALLVGRSIVGIQAGDITRLINTLAPGSGDGLYAVARKEMAPAMLHAAAFNPAVARLALIAPPSSYRSLTMSRYYHSAFISGAVPASLPVYDLPDLAASLAPRKLLIINATSGDGKTNHGVAEDISMIEAAYGTSKNLMILPDAGPAIAGQFPADWLD